MCSSADRTERPAAEAAGLEDDDASTQNLAHPKTVRNGLPHTPEIF